ncbi:MAG: hypothetical protein FIB07_13300 [Candidatus Methanoperedens sp.]|nr:hypothetical protein [Candidatus Methanoperedens sp.]
MDAGNIFLLIGLFAATVSLFFCARKSQYYIIPLSFSFVSISMALVLLIYYFIYVDYTIKYVSIYNIGESLPFRVAALWAGKEGFYLLLVWAVMFCILLFNNGDSENPGFRRKTLCIALVIEIVLLIILLPGSPFEKISPLFDGTTSTGYNLNPKFQNPWFLLHPPLAVLAYAAGVILFASAITFLYSGEKEWAKTARSWGRASWLLLSLSMASGGLWAYGTVGWEGFWRWDPAQSGALVAWLILTAALHAIARHRRNPAEYDMTAPLLSAFVFILYIFIIVLTGKGIKGSEHIFLGNRMWIIFLGAMLLAAGSILFLVLRKGSSQLAGNKGLNLHSIRTSFNATILLLCLLAFVPFWGIMYSIIFGSFSSEFIPFPEDAYNFWSFPLVFMLTLLTGYCLLQGNIKPGKLVIIVALIAITGAAASYLPGTPALISASSDFFKSASFVQLAGSVYAVSYIAMSLLVLTLMIFKLIYGKNQFSSNNAGIMLIHTGFILVILGSVASTSFNRSVDLNYTSLELDLPKSTDAIWSIAVTNVSATSIAWNSSEQAVNVNIYKNGDLHGSGIVRLLRSEESDYFHDLMIHRTFFTDILIHFNSNAFNPVLLKLNIELMPFVNVLWSGVLFMISGIIILITKQLLTKKEILFYKVKGG